MTPERKACPPCSHPRSRSSRCLCPPVDHALSVPTPSMSSLLVLPFWAPEHHPSSAFIFSPHSPTESPSALGNCTQTLHGAHKVPARRDSRSPSASRLATGHTSTFPPFFVEVPEARWELGPPVHTHSSLTSCLLVKDTALP